MPCFVRGLIAHVQADIQVDSCLCAGAEKHHFLLHWLRARRMGGPSKTGLVLEDPKDNRNDFERYPLENIP